MLRTSALGFVCVALSCGCQGENVVRVFNGHEVSGRWISPDSYAAFTVASLEEAKGDERAALHAYERALAEDPNNAAAWGRIGAIQCTSSRREADHAFARAEAIEPDLESPWVARAACALRRNEPEAAVTYGKNAVALSPGDPEANRIVALSLEKRGDSRAAERWRRGFSLVSTLEVDGREQSKGPSDALSKAIDDANVVAAERAAIRARVGSAELSLRAVSRGKLGLAETVASRVLDADPSNSDARIAALAAADLGRNEDAFESTLAAVPPGSALPTQHGAGLLEAILRRRVGDDAARAWRAAYGAAAGR